MCFMTKCPYVPPHEFNLDFPHLMLRYRAVEAKNGKSNFIARQLGEMDRNGTLARLASPVINWASEKSNGLTRPVMAAVADIDRDAELPKFHTKTFVAADRGDPIKANAAAPASGKRKAALFRHLLRQLQQAGDRHGGARRAQSSGRGDARRLSRLLRHAVPGTGRARRASPRARRRCRRNS